MSHKQNKKTSASKGQDPGYSNDQLGENAGEGRLMKEQPKKRNKKS